jgi:hypothetical protein
MDLPLAKFADFVGQLPTARRTSERQYSHGGPFTAGDRFEAFSGQRNKSAPLWQPIFPRQFRTGTTKRHDQSIPNVRVSVPEFNTPARNQRFRLFFCIVAQ